MPAADTTSGKDMEEHCFVKIVHFFILLVKTAVESQCGQEDDEEEDILPQWSH
jgi:hypothetical protein